MRKLFGKIHLWLSVPFGIIIAIVCLTGAVLVFEPEIMQLVRPQLYYVGQTAQKPLPVGQLAGIVARSLPDSVEVTGVSIFADPRRTRQFSLSKPRRASVAIDPYTGEIKGRNERSAFFVCMFKMHRWLLDNAKPDGGIFWGKMIVGVSTLLFVFVLVSGVVIWVPRTKQALKNRLRIATCKGWKRFWFDLHVSAGIYAAALLLVMALTGLTWSFPWYRAGFYKVFGVEMPVKTHSKDAQKERQGSGARNEEARPHGGKARNAKDKQQDRPHNEIRNGNGTQKERHGERHSGEHDAFGPWNAVYVKLASDNPGFTKLTISDGKATVAVKRMGNQRAADSYKFDPHSGEITEVVRYEDSERASKLRGWIYTLHTGGWGGLFSKIVTFLAAWVGATLPLTGYYLWIKRLRRKSNTE